MNKRIAMLVAIIVVVSVIVASCDTAPAPVTLSQLPTYSGAAKATNAAVTDMGNQMADGVSKLSISGASVKSVEHQEFSLPSDATADLVTGFFNTELAKNQWTSDPQLAGSTGPVTYKGWMRGSQAVYAYHVTDASGTFGGNVLVVLLVTLAK